MEVQFKNVVIPCKVQMGVCSVCANLKSMAKSGRTDVEIKKYKTLLKEHQESQALERSKAMHHRQKALQSPEQYMCLIIDAMDKKKHVCHIFEDYQRILEMNALYKCT